jgi:hypothetical protein
MSRIDLSYFLKMERDAQNNLSSEIRLGLLRKTCLQLSTNSLAELSQVHYGEAHKT